jgi:uncharacterized protein
MGAVADGGVGCAGFVGHCKRCMIITVNPDNAELDSSLHKTFIKENNNHFGIYASVITTGDIHVDDEVHFLIEH